MNCPDNWHCCPRGTHCSPDCNFRSCKCLSPYSHPAAAPKFSKEAKESKMKPKSHSGSHSTSGKLMKESKGKKELSKTEKVKKKKNKAKDTSTTKSRKKAREKSKHKLKLKDKKNKKHKQSRKEKGRKKTKKSRSKAKDKGRKSEKLKKFKKTKAIQKINKHVVKAHKTYQKTNFHPTTKQHWVTLLNDRLDAPEKHKPNIKFSHTWGKRKHQKLSYKSNGNNNSRLQTDASMADELKHLIVKHRKEKLRRRLKLRVNGHTKHKHGSHRNGLIDRRKSTTRKKDKGRTIHPTHTRNIFKHRDSNSSATNKNVKARKTPHEANKEEKNQSGHAKHMLGHENRVSVNVFNNLRQTLHEKVLAKANISLGLNPSKHNGKIAEHFATNTSDNKTDELGKSKADIILESEKATDSSKDLQRTSFKARTSSRSDKNESQHMNTVNLKEMSDASGNASANLAEHSLNSTSNSSSAGDTAIIKEGEPSNSVAVSVSDVVTKVGQIQPQTNETESRTNSLIITKPNSTQSGIDETTAGENKNRLAKVNGKAKDGATQHNKTFATVGTKNLSSTDTDSARLVTGMRNQAKADWVGSGSGLEADVFSTGSASGLETPTTFSGDYDDSNIDEHIKVFLGGEDTESSTLDLEKNETTKELLLVDSSSGSSTNEGKGSYKTSPWKSLYAESADVESFSGSSFETFSAESDSDLHFGGEGDGYEDKPEYGDEKYFYSSGRDGIHQSGLFPSSGTTSLNRLQKLKTAKDEQSLKQQNEDSSSGYSLSTDISQMTYNDWDDGREIYSGLESGHYESSTDRWGTGSGVDGFSSESLPTEAKPISSRNYTAGKTLNIANSMYQSSGDSDEERNENEMVSGEGINLEKRNHVLSSNSGSQMRFSEGKRRRSKSLRQKYAEKTKDSENNDLLSWKDRELQQLLYWLSTANADDNKHFNQIMAYKDIASGYSRLHSMVLQKIFPNFSKSNHERDKVNRKYGKEKEAFLLDTLLGLSASGSGTETSKMLNFLGPEFSGDAAKEPDNEFKDTKE